MFSNEQNIEISEDELSPRDRWNKKVDEIKRAYESTFEQTRSQPGELVWKEFESEGETPVFATLQFLPEVSVQTDSVEHGFSERAEGSGVPRILSYLSEKEYPVAGARIPWKDQTALDKFVEKLRDTPSLKTVGIAAFSFETPWALQAADIIKQQIPEVNLVLGGPHADTVYVRPERFRKAYGQEPAPATGDDSELRNLLQHFDYVVMGSGEVALDQLLSKRSGSRPLLRGGVPEKYSNTQTAEALNRFINPVRVLGGNESGFFPLPENYSGVATYTGTEGCPNNCSFCTSALTCERNYVDRRESVGDLVTAVKNSKENLIWFDNEISQLPWLRTFSNEMISQDVQDKFWIFMGSIGTFASRDSSGEVSHVRENSRETFELMARAGCLEICYGVESINPNVVRDYNKPTTAEARDEVLKLTSDAGIIPRAMMVFGSPMETDETLAAFVQWAKSCPALSFRIAYATPFQGTPDWYDANSENRWISDELRNNLEHHTTEEPVVKCPTITVDGSSDGEIDDSKLEKFRDFKINALKEIYNSPEYHAKITEFIKAHPDKAVVLRGLIYLFERQGLVTSGSFDAEFEKEIV